MALFSDKSWRQWVEEYSQSHQHPINQRCHFVGIPTIVLSLLIFPLGFLHANFLYLAIALFIVGWGLQFIGHYYEKKPPEFLKDWRFLFVGLRWWLKKF